MTAVAIGNFDGVHRGHRALLAAARGWADAHETRAIALTFEPHPSVILCPNLAPVRITSPSRKRELIEAAGLSAHVLPFTPELAQLSAVAFIEEHVRGALGAKHVVVGYDFNYGHARGGTTSTLEAHGARAGFTV